jgi:hypothetical protein
MSRRQPIARFWASLQAHPEFVVILVLAIAFRFLAILVFRPGGYLGEMSDFGYYRLLLSFTNPSWTFGSNIPLSFPGCLSACTA